MNAAIDAGVKTLYLFHLDPNYPDDMVAKLHESALDIVKQRGSNMRCLIAHEGDLLDLDTL